MNEPTTALETREQGHSTASRDPKQAGTCFYCDRCRAAMFEDRCKIVCANCGNRFDCSDLNLYFD